MITRFAEDLLAEYRAARAAGRAKVVFIVPVGPVGQFDLVAGRASAERIRSGNKASEMRVHPRRVRLLAREELESP